MDASSKAAWRSTTTLGIGDFTADPSANELHRDGDTLRVRPLLMDVLLRLASTPGEVVTREQLIADVWSRKMVNDEVLSRAIGELRTLLGDDAKQPRYIETLPKVGYRLIALVGSAPVRAAPPHANAPIAESVDTAPHGSATPEGHAEGDRGNAGPAATATLEPARAGTRAGWLRSRRRLAIGAAAAIVLLAAAAILLRPTPAPLASLATQLGQAQSFASDTDLEVGPRFSPDGTQVIYAQARGREAILVVRDLKGSDAARIVKPGIQMLSPVMLPDGKRIVFWQRTGEDCAIVERELASGAERNLIGCAGEPRTVTDIAPDGESLVVSLRPRPQHPYGIARVRLADGKVDMLTVPQPGEGDDVRPRFSPDGTRVVFSRGNNSHGRLWMLETEKPGSARALPVPEGLDYGVAWLGRDGPLLVAADWAGFRSLNLVDLATGQVDQAGARGARFPDVSRHGDIVFENATYQADLWLTDADNPGGTAGDAVKVLWPSTRYTNQPGFSPDGRQVVFVSNREGAEALYIGTLGGDARRLTLATDSRYIRPRWTPDGTALYAVKSPVSARQSGPHQAVRIDAASGRIETIPALGDNVAEVQPLADGALLVAETSGNGVRLSRVAGGKSERLPFPVLNEFQVEGDDIVYLQPDLSIVTRCTLSKLQCAPLPMPLDDADRYHWHLGHGVLWYRGRNAAGAAQLMKFDLASGVTRAFDFAPTGAGTSLSTSPDGRQLIVTRESKLHIDLMLARKP